MLWGKRGIPMFWVFLEGPDVNGQHPAKWVLCTLVYFG